MEIERETEAAVAVAACYWMGDAHSPHFLPSEAACLQCMPTTH